MAATASSVMISAPCLGTPKASRKQRSAISQLSVNTAGGEDAALEVDTFPSANTADDEMLAPVRSAARSQDRQERLCAGKSVMVLT
ncbi:hypothetical protein YTPLAS18_32550 [Nitrospira sp.]|nr:hypothetical protein YTPLAS18_32550 [Nitrospira sp.]